MAVVAVDLDSAQQIIDHYLGVIDEAT